MSEENDICFAGYDPLPVLFKDETKIRSFPTKYWNWDFGDSYVYACPATANIDAFTLPGDFQTTGWCSDNNEFVKAVTAFQGSKNNCLMNLKESSYHYRHVGGVNNIPHFTGVKFQSSTDSSGSGCTATGEDKRYRRLPSDGFNEFVGVGGIDTIADSCDRDNCADYADFGNDVMHIYKGPGLYLSSMTCSSEEGLRGMEVSSGVMVSGCDEYVKTCAIKVYPVCPCISGFEVYGSEANKKFKVLTDFNYSDDDPSGTLESKLSTTVDFNCYVRDTSGVDHIAISGYAPFVKVAASGVVIPRSLPVSGAWIDWSDWFTDYRNEDKKDFGEVISGWPFWDNVMGRDISGEHVYTMPGLYSVGIAPVMHEKFIKNNMPTVYPEEYENCPDTTLISNGSAVCVLSVEIPPKNAVLNEDLTIGEDYPTVVSGFSFDCRAGSYPISRIDWDFGDGSQIVSCCKEFMHNMSFNSDTTTGTLGPCVSADSVNYWVGQSTIPSRGSYETHDPRKITFAHTYSRTNKDEYPDGYTVSVTAYAENTNTPISASIHILPDGAKLPSFEEVEGSVEMVDVGMDDDGNANLILHGEKTKQIYINRLEES